MDSVWEVKMAYYEAPVPGHSFSSVTFIIMDNIFIINVDFVKEYSLMLSNFDIRNYFVNLFAFIVNSQILFEE